MSDERFYKSLGDEMMFHSFAEEKLTPEEREAFNLFNDEYDMRIQGRTLSNAEEGELIEDIFDSIPGSREAFDKFNRIVESMEKQAKKAYQYKNN